jgi:hypothetical protein
MGGCSLSHDLNAPALGAASWPLAEKRHSEMQHSPPEWTDRWRHDLRAL